MAAEIHSNLRNLDVCVWRTNARINKRHETGSDFCHSGQTLTSSMYIGLIL